MPQPPSIAKLEARAIPDSRGLPTVEAILTLSDGTSAAAAVPSGTSTGTHEAVELRDGDLSVAGGKGVTKAVGNVVGEIQAQLKGTTADLIAIDQQLLALDGTPNKHRLGANAILAVSLALARALAQHYGEPLYAFLARCYGRTLPEQMPIPQVNLIEGGRHAETPLSVQEFHIISSSERTAEQVAEARRVFEALGLVLAERQLRIRPGYEGTYTAPFRSHVEVFDAISEAMHRADVDGLLSIDAAASEFTERGGYRLQPEEVKLSAERLCAEYQSWARRFPLKLIEDPVAEDDWEGWHQAATVLQPGLQLIGDDFFTTNPARIRRAFDEGLRVAVLLKPNQIGTITETVEAKTLADAAGVPTVMSNRSGETLDPFIADLAVALGCTYLKAGGPFAPERAAKYDRLVAIAEECHA